MRSSSACTGKFLVARFTALCLTATGAPPAARCIGIIPMNEGMRKRVKFLDSLTALHFTVITVVHESKFVRDLPAEGSKYKFH